jgi:hypothetical protein
MKLKIILGLAAVLCYLLSAASLFAESDLPPTMLAPEGGSVWDKALANPNYNDGSGNESDSNGSESDNSGSTSSGDSGSSGSGQTTGGRLVDPNRDVRYSDGTIGVDVLNP